MKAQTLWEYSEKTADGERAMVTLTELEKVEKTAYQRGYNEGADGA